MHCFLKAGIVRMHIYAESAGGEPHRNTRLQQLALPDLENKSKSKHHYPVRLTQAS